MARSLPGDFDGADEMVVPQRIGIVNSVDQYCYGRLRVNVGAEDGALDLRFSGDKAQLR